MKAEMSELQIVKKKSKDAKDDSMEEIPLLPNTSRDAGKSVYSPRKVRKVLAHHRPILTALMIII